MTVNMVEDGYIFCAIGIVINHPAYLSQKSLYFPKKGSRGDPKVWKAKEGKRVGRESDKGENGKSL